MASAISLAYFNVSAYRILPTGVSNSTSAKTEKCTLAKRAHDLRDKELNEFANPIVSDHGCRP